MMKETGGSKSLIAGVACRLPKSSNLQEFWENLIDSHDMIDKTRFPKGLEGVPPRAGLIPDVDKFDAGYFGFTDVEADSMNVMLRHLLEVTYECVVDSGLPEKTLQDNVTGLYLACFLPDTDPIETTKYTKSKLCTTTPFLTGQMTSYFGWKGPAVSVDTACSSSLSALEMADTDLKTGRCQFAVVASVNLLINPVYFQQMAILGMLNPTGESKVFDRDAGGYVRAEGVAAIILTRKENLCRRIYSTLVDVMTNCDGYTPEGISFPNNLTQKKLLEKIYKRAGVDSDQLAYMELHSTGTKVGDKVEIGAVTDVLCPGRSSPLPIGSVKGNMGHSEATAGLASLMKCLLVARYKKIPPQLNYRNPNPRIPAVNEGKVTIVNQVTPLEDGYIGLNSFGFGGANGHLILKPYRKDRKENDQKYCLLPYRARTLEEVDALCRLSDLSPTILVDLYGLLAGSILSHDQKRPIKGYLISSRQTEGLVYGWTVDDQDQDETKVNGKIGLFLPNFVWDPVVLDKDLLDIPGFLISLEKSQQILTDKLGSSFFLVDKMRSEETLSIVTAENLCVAIAAQIGLVDCIQECGLPISYVGASGLSEITAGYVDGCLTQEQCLHIALVLGKALQEFENKQELPDKIYKVHFPLEMVYLLGPKVRVLASPSMDTSIILVRGQYSNQILQDIHNKGGFYKELQQRIPFHSHNMINCLNSLSQTLEDIIKSPKQSSSRLLQRKHDFLPGLESRSVAFSAKYLIEMLSQTCQPFKASLPDDMVMVNIHLSGQSEEVEEFIINANPRQKLTNISLKSDPVSTLKALGEVFLHGHDIKVEHLYKTEFPLDVSVPSVSPVIRWNHNTSWYIPEWHEFFNKVKDVGVSTYTIEIKDKEDITTPMALLLYHTWKAVTRRHKAQTKDNIVAVEIQSLALHNEELWNVDLMAGAAINIQELQRNFTITNQGLVLLTGSFKVHTQKLELPRIPGFDLDINQNVEVCDEEEEIEKTEILWEDNWLDFINTALEFTVQSLVGPLTRIIIHPDGHSKEVESCANILTVAEKITGICKAGSGLVLQTLVTKAQQELHANSRKVNITDGEHTLVKMTMAYGIQGNSQACDQLLLYQGTDTVKDTNVIGILIITDEETVCREIPTDREMDLEELQQLTPYFLAHYITTTVAEVKRGDKVLVSHPIDTVAVYIMAIVEELGGVIFVSSYDADTRQMLDRVFPYARILSGSNIVSKVKSVTQGEGCDICVKFTSGELDEALSLVSHNGRMIQCSPMLDTESLDLGFLSHNTSVKLPTMTEAFRVLMEKSQEDIEEMLYDLKHGNVVKLTAEGFPEAKGLLYSLEEHASFVNPVPFPKLLTVLEEPRIGLMESFEERVTADVVAMEKLHNCVMSKPKDYSLAENCLNTSRADLNTAVNPTPPSNNTETSPKSPDIFIFSLNDISLEGTPPGPPTPHPSKAPGKINPKIDTKMTSTPMITITEAADKAENLHESYIEPTAPIQAPSSNKLQVGGVKGTKFLSPLSLSGISNLQAKKSGKRQVDLLFVGPPHTPLTPAVQNILSPNTQESNIVPLNSIQTGEKTVFMIHPITGKLTLLKKLGENLFLPVYGIQRTLRTPRDSIHSVASYYLNAIQMLGPREQHYLIGYSFGAIVAIEMAIQLQASGKKVADLILLDGAPNLLQSQMQDNDQLRSKGKTDDQISAMFEVGSLMSYMYMFKSIENPSLTKKILANLPTQKARIDTAVDMTFGNVNIGASPRHTKWLTAKHKILKKLKEPIKKDHAKYGMADAAQELLRLKRIEAASDHIKSIKMVYNFRAHHNRRFDGNIYLLRIKSDPQFLTHHLSPDYDLHDWCTGKVQIKFYEGTHESFLSGINAPNVAKDITEILTNL